MLYVLADRLDHDPWLVLLFRGREREVLLDALASTDIVFGIDDAAWAEFNALLERPAEHKAKLEKLLSQPGPWVK